MNSHVAKEETVFYRLLKQALLSPGCMFIFENIAVPLVADTLAGMVPGSGRALYLR